MQFTRARIKFVLFLIALILFFTSDFQLIDIEKTAIIVALGIDKEGDEFEVSAQVAIPQATSDQATNSDAMISGKGKSMYEAIENISLKTGWYPKLSFCNLIIFGNEVVNQNFYPLVDYILTSDRFQTSAILCTTDKKASDILRCTTPLDFISSFALQKILLRNVERAKTVLAPDVREFCVNNRSRSQFCYLPLVKFIEEDSAKTKGSEQNSKQNRSIANIFASQGSGGKSGAGSSDSNEQKVGVFDASETMFFSNGKPACTISSKQTLCFNLLSRKANECFFDVSFEKNGKDTNALISIIQNRGDIRLEIKNNIPKLKINLTLTCEKEETFLKENNYELQNPSAVSPEGLKALESAVYEHIEQLIKISSQSKCDFFQLKNLLYQKHNKHYASLKDGILNNLSYEIKVTCKSKSKA